MTRSDPTSQDDARNRPSWRLALLLYPFVVLAISINLFMLGLLATWLGWPHIPPVPSLIASLFLALPANYAATRWIERLIARAESR